MQIVSTTTRFAFIEPANGLECNLLAISQETYIRPGNRFLAEKNFEKNATGSCWSTWARKSNFLSLSQ